jgi:hypothetical protein
MKRFGHILLVAGFAFAGGFAAQLMMGTATGYADGAWQTAHALMVADDKNVKGIESYINDGQPGQIFYGEDGKMRLQMGTYSGAGERGMPLLSLNDNKGEIKMLLRIAGASESPVIVMKDNSGRDRLVMGLSFDDKQEPFLSITGADGQAKDIFGHYGGHP